jgi:hypothetical protein
VQPDGRLLVYSTYEGFPGPIRRLLANGALDASFDPDIHQLWGDALLGLQPDGKVLVGGSITFRDGTQSHGLARLNPDGSLDRAFQMPSQDSYVQGSSLALQDNGDILLAGIFDSFNGLPRAGLVRLKGIEPPPGFSRIRISSESGVVLTLQGIPGNRYLIQASTDLNTWFDLGEIVLPSDPTSYSMELEHPDSRQFPRLFYRASKSP